MHRMLDAWTGGLTCVSTSCTVVNVSLAVALSGLGGLGRLVTSSANDAKRIEKDPFPATFHGIPLQLKGQEVSRDHPD